MQDASPDVRQSAFALVGDLSKVHPGHLLPCTPQLVSLAVANLQPQNITQENMSACNNACWSLGGSSAASAHGHPCHIILDCSIPGLHGPLASSLPPAHPGNAPYLGNNQDEP